MTFSKASCSSILRLYLIIVSCIAFQCNADHNHTSTLVIDASDGSGRPIPNTLFGIFFEVGNCYGASSTITHILKKLNITKLYKLKKGYGTFYVIDILMTRLIWILFCI